MKRIALLGNPNVGKSVLFGYLTGRYVTVSNYPGTTVEIAEGILEEHHNLVTLVDTPGVNTLLPISEEERVTRDILAKGVDGVIQVADAKNLRRALVISLQLSEMGIPFILDVNMEDEAESLGITVDKDLLAARLGVPVIGTVAIQKKGLGQLKKAIQDFEASCAPEPQTEGLEEPSPQHPSMAIRRHLRAVDRLLDGVLRTEPAPEKGWSAALGRLMVHPGWGFVFLAGVLALLYLSVGKFAAQTAVDWLEHGVFEKYVHPASTFLFSKIFFFSPFFKDLFVGPYGVITMALTYALAILLPIVTTFFFFFGLMEDTGYLPRLSVMLNRLFRALGLNGKAVVPMVLGLGCDTMATMSARILDTRKERILVTLLLALGIPCSAQLGIILGLLGSLPFWATFLWGGAVGFSLVLVGYTASRVLPGSRSDFLVEIPPLRRPNVTNLLKKTAARLEWYLREATPLFVLGTFILFLLDRIRFLPVLERGLAPLVVRFLNLPPEGAEAFLLGFLRRDYGATRFFDLYREGQLTEIQAIVALVVMTLFVPCLANVLMIVKEQGWKVATAIVAFIYPFSFAVGGLVNWGLRL